MMFEDRGFDDYDVAQVCWNGHLITESLIANPQYGRKFCDRCGAQTISQCEACTAAIRGRLDGVGFSVWDDSAVPKYCDECGAPYPWTAAALQAMRDLVAEADLDVAEREQLSASIADLVQDTPRTPVAASRYKRLAAKAGQEFVAGSRAILTDVVSETVKKLIWGP